jgi:hypothetical protein
MFQVSKATIFSICLLQAGVTAFIILSYPQVKIETFTAHPKVVNGTLQADTANHVIHSATVPLSLPFMVLSCMAALFTTTTMSLIERNTISTDSPYTIDTLSETGMWNATFWAYCLGAHVLVILIALSPVDIYIVVLSSLMIVYFLNHTCNPKDGAHLSIMQENFNLLGIFIGILIILYNIPDSHSGRTAAIAVTIMLDYILAVGHTWDSAPEMDVICNCRIFWTCAASLCLAGLYGAWHDSLLMDSI